MARLASALPPWLLLVPLLLRGDTLLAAPVGEDVHYLTCNVTITPRGRTGESYEVKIQLDGKDTTASNCTKNLSASLKDTAKETKKPLLETEPGHHRTSYFFSLQCQREANGSIHGNLIFGSGKKIYLKLYMKEKHWRVVDPVGRELMEKLSQDNHLNMTYEKILIEHCNALPKLVKCKKMETKAPPSRPSDEPRWGDFERNSTAVSIPVPSNTTSSPSLPTQHSPRIGISTSAIIVIVISIFTVFLILLCCLWKPARAKAKWVGHFLFTWLNRVQFLHPSRRDLQATESIPPTSLPMEPLLVQAGAN